MRRSITSVAVPLVATLLLAACSGAGASPTPTRAPATPTAVPSTGAPSASTSAGVAVAVASSPLGQILVDGSGNTLYGFTKDTGGTPSCYEDCAKAWPALIATGSATAGTGVDQAKLTTVARTDATMQVKYGEWPLYYFAKDTAAGQTNGQGVGGIWWVVAPSGELIATAASPSPSASTSGGTTVAVWESPLGQILVDGSGNALYGFTKDTGGTPSCYDACAGNWPALVATGSATAGTGVDQAKLSTVDRTDGKKQVKYGDWPLYTFASDTTGQTGGQGIGGFWFVVAPSGELIKKTASRTDEY